MKQLQNVRDRTAILGRLNDITSSNVKITRIKEDYLNLQVEKVVLN